MKLPLFFEENFRSLMDESEFQRFIASFDGNRHLGLRINTLKIEPGEFLEFIEKTLEPIPWVDRGFYYREGEAFGKHPAYHAGLYYIQEPSAMMPAMALSPEPFEKVLDLCAAPGGKTAFLGNLMNNTGLLVTNDISPKRVKALVKNVELMGLSNTLIINEEPERIKKVYSEFFDKILLDVPCSGEGMFRKDREAVQSYTRFKSEECVAVQREIVDSAYAMLKPGGVIVYSTCTFNPDENERNIEFFIKKYDLKVDNLIPAGGFEPSRSRWTDSRDSSLDGGLRLWPHNGKGEGHFVCRLVKGGIKPSEECIKHRLSCTSKVAEEAYAAYRDFSEQYMNIPDNGIYHMRGTSLYRLPAYIEEIPALRWEKAGLYLGEYQKGRYEPSQSLLMASRADDFKQTISFERNDRNIIRYLKGETLFNEGGKGYAAVLMEKYPLGWVKQEAGMLKNLYPKGWRMM